MYPRKRIKEKSLADVDELNIYSEEMIEKGVEEGSLSPEEAGFLKGNNKGNFYEEDEEENEGGRG